MVEALQLQKRDVIRKETASKSTSRMSLDQLHVYETATDNACRAIVSLSNACKITQKYSISEIDLVDLNR